MQKKKKSKKKKKIKSDNFSYNLKQLLCLEQFWAHFGHFWPKNLKTRSFPTTQDCVAVTLCKKSEELHALIYHETWKTSFWVPFGPKSLNDVFPPQKWIYVNSKSLRPCNFM